MNWIRILVFALSLSLAFLIGVTWSSNPFKSKSMPTLKGASIDSMTSIDQIKAFLNSKYIPDSNQSFKELLKGRFLLEGSESAGFDFFSPDQVSWTNELSFNASDTLSIKWLSDSIFTVRSLVRNNKECPPIVWAYQVMKFDGQNLLLREFWLGWGVFDDELTLFVKAK